MSGDSHGASLVLDLALVLGVAAITSPIARRLGQPTVLAYLIAGLVVGPYIPIPLFADAARVETLAELGVVLVMFGVGLELRVARLLRVLPTAGLTGAVQVGFLFWCGFAFAERLGWGTTDGLFLGACVAISSTMVVSRALTAGVDEGLREHVLGILVVQDVLAIVLVAVMTGVAAGSGLEPEALGGDLLRLAGVLVGMVVVGLLLVPRIVRWVASLVSDEVLVVVSVGLCFVLAALASELGYSVALGAFVAGVLVAESGHGHAVARRTEPLKDVFAGIFFVSVGMTVDPREALQSLPVALGVTVLVIVAQLAVVSMAGLVSGMGVRRSVTAGLALGQIGEFGFILAAVGVSAGVARPELRSILVTVAVLTAFTTPLAIRASPRIVSLVDRAMPKALRRLLALHEQWVARLRAGSSDGRASRIRVGVRALAWDVGLVFGIVLLTASLSGEAVPAVAARLGVASPTARVLWLAGAVAVILPVLAVTVRTTRSLATAVLAPPESAAPSPARVRALTVLLLIGLTALVGFPSATVLGAVLPDGHGILFVLVVLAALTIIAIRSARKVDAEVRSAAARLVAALSSDEDEPPADAEEVDLGTIARVRLTDTSPAHGRTLTELDLRARTSATVLAIHRGRGPVTLPKGAQRLEDGDELVLAGTAEALDAARAALLGT